MGQKEIIIKVLNDKIHLNPGLSVPIQRTNIPKKYLTFRSHKEIFWKVEMRYYDTARKCLKVSVLEYETSEIEDFDNQEPKKPVNELLFEKFDWQKLEPLLTFYQKINLIEILFNIGTNPFSRGEREINVNVRPALIPSTNPALGSNRQPEPKPTISVIEDEFLVNFSDAHFMMGYVTFKKHVNKIGRELNFKIPNQHILAEFDNIKFWFAKKLKTNRFKVVASITLNDNEVMETNATSTHIELITPELIDGVKYQRTLALIKEPRLSNPDKSLFTSEDIFTQIDTDDVEGNVFNQSEDDILDFFLKRDDVRNKQQLSYLAGKKQSENYKLRYTLYPNFGFLFFIEGAENNHFVWELLRSNATYLWSIEKGKQNTELQFKRIEVIVNSIRTSGREIYRRSYKNSHQDDDLVFRIISHDDIGSKLIDAFPKWKNKLNEQLT